MRNSAPTFTLRKDGRPKSGDWFSIVNKAAEDTTEIRIYDEIGFWGTSAEDFIKELDEVTTSQIDLRINSPGGEIFDGIAIYNALQRHKAKVITTVDALAASAASFVAQAADELYMTKNAVMMIHDGIAFCYGNEKDMTDTAEVLGKLSNNIASIYQARAGETVDYWRDLMREETWFSADETVEANLADEVMANSDEEAEEETNKWDLTYFNYAGRDKAPSPRLLRERILISNRAKESKMGGRPNPKATSDPQVDPSTDPQTQPPEGDPPETDPQADPTTDPPETDPAPVTDPPEGGAPSNTAPVYMINGQRISDPAQVQAALTAHEKFQTETAEANRRTFVNQLATDNKILASELDKTLKFVLNLTNEQYAEWSALQESAQVQPQFGEYGASTGDKNKPPTGTPEDRAEILRGIIAMHRNAGMPEAQLKELPSYTELQELDKKS